MTTTSAIPTVQQTVDQLRTNCVTSEFNPCTTRMAGYLHGLMKKDAIVPTQFHYAVLEVVFGCEIYTFSQLTFHTCQTLINMLQTSPDISALFYTIYQAIEAKIGKDHEIVPGEFKDFLYACGNEQIYAF